MKLLDLIFGEKKTVNIPDLGTFVSQRIKGQDFTKNYTWSCSRQLCEEGNTSTLILEGNLSGPNNQQVESVTEILKNWKSKYTEIITDHLKKSNPEMSNWEKDFYLGAVYPLNELNPEFEIALEPIDEENTQLITVEFKNNSITKVEVLK